MRKGRQKGVDNRGRKEEDLQAQVGESRQGCQISLKLNPSVQSVPSLTEGML